VGLRLSHQPGAMVFDGFIYAQLSCDDFVRIAFDNLVQYLPFAGR